MAIQIPNPGTGNGATGDNEFVLWSKVKDNFSDQTNAASKLVGTGSGQIPLANDVYKAANTHIQSSTVTPSANDFELGTKLYYRNTSVTDSMEEIYPSQLLVTETVAMRASNGFNKQYAHLNGSNSVMVRNYSSGSWSEWTALSTNTFTYKTTTASGANVVVTSSGELQRSTSSERYKDILSPLELDDARYAKAMALKPIVYRSTADADNPDYHYYSFSAEELGAYDPAFTLWSETETVIDDEGNSVEQPLAERQAEGININALLAMGHAIAIKQGELIKKLEARIEALEEK